jgi:hypothetical protein
MKTAVLALLLVACSPGPAPVASSPRDPSNPAAPEGAAAPPVGATSAAEAPEDHAHHGHGAGAADAGAVVYTCPMHADVVSPGPGSCPKCGMHLVPNK